MKIQILKMTMAAICIVAFAMVLKSCKKVNNTTSTGLSDKDLADIRKKLTDHGMDISTIIDKKADRVYYVNKKGDTVDFKALQRRPENGLSVPCDGISCSDEDATGDGDITAMASPDITLQSCTRSLGVCPSGFTANTLSVSWQVAVPYTLLASKSPTLLSKGKIYITNTSGATVYSNTNITPVTITPLGADPNCSARKLFQISYSISGIPDADFSDGYTLNNGMSCYTDCDIMGFIPINYQASFSWSIAGVVNSPCTRADKMYISPLYTSGTHATALAIGNAAFNCPTNSYPPGWIITDQQEIRYWKNNAPTVIYGGMVGYTGMWDMTQATYGSGAWTVRYRNHKNASGSTPACDGPWYYEYWTF